MTKNHKNNKNVGLSNALEDLDQAFASLEVKPLSRGELGRIAGGTLGCNTSGATCNSKCGPTNYWECPSEAGGCFTNVEGCNADPTYLPNLCHTNVPGGCT